MLIAFISDIHGNNIAFEILLKKLKKEGVDKIFFLGDSVGYFPDGENVVKGLVENNIECVLGNHDAMMLGYLSLNEKKDEVYLLKKQFKELSHKSIEKMSKWLPYRFEIIEDYKVLLVHGNPFNPLSGYVYPDTSLEIFNDLDFDVIIMGHTHRPFSKFQNNKHIINTGSVGLPRDHGNRASYVLWDTKNKSFEIKRFTIPIDNIISNYSAIHDSVIKVLKRNNI
ncbi:MAG: putative phosphoesterase [Planctomycetota bacterium]|jgi:putative phosphoesterase